MNTLHKKMKIVQFIHEPKCRLFFIIWDQGWDKGNGKKSNYLWFPFD